MPCSAGEIADGLVGVACHHEGGVQSAVTEPLQPVVGRGGDDGGKTLGLPAHGIEQGLAGDVLAGPGCPDRPVSLDVGQGVDVAVGAGEQGQRLLMKPIEAAQLVVGRLIHEGAGAVGGMVHHIGLHQRQLHFPLMQRLQVSKGAGGALHRAVQAMAGRLFIEQPANGATGRVVDAVERPSTDGEIGRRGCRGNARAAASHGRCGEAESAEGARLVGA